MSKTLDELRQQERKQSASLQKTRNHIQDRENIELLPRLRKQYEGKYFTYKNSCGNKTWPLYVYCRKVTKANPFFSIAVVDTFETTPTEYKFHMETLGGEYLFQIHITKREWDCALRAFRQSVERLGQE